MADTELEKLRAQISGIDDRLFTALIERARVARKIGEFKRVHGVSKANVYQPERENALIDALIARDHAPLPDSWLKRHYREIFSICRALQKDQEHSGADGEQATTKAGGGIQGYGRAQILEIFSGKKIAFLGPRGTYSHEAVRTMFPAHTDGSVANATHEPAGTVELLELPSIDKVFDALKSGQAQAAFIPVANSTTGTIEKHFRQVLEEDLQVFYELKNPIRHCLWSKDKNMKLAEIGLVHGHSQALQQCEMWMIDHIGPNPNTGPVCSAHDSSGEALRQIQSESSYHDPRGDRDVGDADTPSPGVQQFVRRGRAAIAGPHVGVAYDLHMIYENIQDKADNATTFWALCTRGWLPPPSAKIRPDDSRTHLSCFLPDSPGSLHRLTDLFCKRGLNMSSIQSFRNSVRRLPADSTPGNAAASGDYEHVFQIEVDGALDHEQLITEAADQGLLVLWLGTTAGE